MIILPKNPTIHEIYIAAAYFIITGSQHIEDVVTYQKKDERSNIYSEEILTKINDCQSKDLSYMIDLHIRSKVCEPIIESSKSAIEAIDKIATILKQDCA